MDAGSRVEYGLTDGIMSEDRECHPINQYGKAKWEFYQKAAPLCKELGMHYLHLRFSASMAAGITLVHHIDSGTGAASGKDRTFKRLPASLEFLCI